MNSRRNTLVFCGLVFLTWSCASTQRFTALQLDILRPAKLDIPETQKNVGIKYAKNNQWEEASAIWEKYTNNKNKNIAAKAMFNMALASEVSGEIGKALDWVIKSYMVFHESNEVHSFNTKDYISLLALRKREYQVLDKQLKN